MTTAHSPLRVLKAQADRIAANLKVLERGETPTANDPLGKVAAARARESITFAVAMDDKIIKIEMTWAAINQASEAGISEFILR